MDENLNIVDAIFQTPEHTYFTPFALTTDATGGLYVVLNGIWSKNSAGFEIAVFDKDLVYIKTIPFAIKSNAEYVLPESLAVNPDGSFYLTLQAKEKDEDGKIYSISSDGKVSVVAGNKSFGYLLALPEGLFFVNSSFPYGFDKETGKPIHQFGLSALYKLPTDGVATHVILPPAMKGPLSEKELEKWVQIYTELNGEAPSSEEISNTRKDGSFLFMMNGSGGLFRLGDDIAVAFDGFNVMHVFSTELEYRYSQYLNNGFAEYYKDFITNPSGISIFIAACVVLVTHDETVAAYAGRRIVMMDGQITM